MSYFPVIRRYAGALALLTGCVLLSGAARLGAPAWASIPPDPVSPAPGRFFSKEPLAKGKFLVASEEVKDGHFSRTVILLTEYGWHGAVGIIINRPTKAAPATVLPYVKGLEKMDDVVWFGGPVDTGQITMLIRSKAAPAASARVLSDVYASTSIETLGAMLEGNGAGMFRLYAGYAGWAPQQLELEVAQGGWYVMDAGSAEVFDGDAGSVWERLMGRVP